MIRTAAIFASLSLALFACRGGDDGGGDDTTTGDDAPGTDAPGNAGVVTVQEIQNDSMPPLTQVELRGVVVLAVDTYGAKQGDLWVGEPEGGEFSGVKVFGAPIDTVALLKAGDIVDISNAVKEEFACTGTICGGGVFVEGQSITEIKPIQGGTMTITKTGTGALPPASMVDAKAIGEMADEAARKAEWEKWEGVRIKVVNARQLTGVSGFGGMADDQKKFNITGDALVETVLGPFPAEAVAGMCYGGITGIGDYFFDYMVLPTAATDYELNGTGCTQLSTATIADVNSGAATGSVELKDVYVTAISSNRKNLWVSQSLTAAANEGVYVYGTGANLAADVVVGAKVNVLGNAIEYNNDVNGDTLTEIEQASVVVTAAPTTPPVPVTGQTVTTLLAAATGEPYEGVLVTLTNVKVATVAAGAVAPDFGVSQVAQYPGNVAFTADDDVRILVAGDLNACYATIMGIWHYNVRDNRYTFLPTAPGTGTGVCN